MITLVYGPIPDDPPYSPREFQTKEDLISWYNDVLYNAEEPALSFEDAVSNLEGYGYSVKET